MLNISLLLIQCYFWIVLLYILISIASVCTKFHVIEEVYVATLYKLFSFAAHFLTKENGPSDSTEYKEGAEEVPSNDDNIIERSLLLSEEITPIDNKISIGRKSGFRLHFSIYLVKSGVEAIIEDGVTKRFTAAEMRVWNFLSRNKQYVYINNNYKKTLTLLWVIGFFIRYFLLFPGRIITFSLAIMATWVIGTIGRVTSNESRRFLENVCLPRTVRLALCPFSAIVRFHGNAYKPRENTICVANHTTPFDWCVLSSDITYAVVGQKHPGFFGLVERVISAAAPAVWFDRSEILDRHKTAERLRSHVSTPGALPLLIFPEGTCINNTSVMKFKKGCFEIGAPIHPVAIKYDPLFADCFWNSSRDSLFQYSLKMMTSWAMVVDVWYLPPTIRQPDEDGIEFARRVQESIARCGGMIDMNWDGELKRQKPKPTMLQAQQKLISECIVGSTD